jgi:hypothetical protein
MFPPSLPFDAQLSAQLNDVPLPDGFLARLRMVPLASDADFDRALTDVATPADLTDRLSAIALSAYPESRTAPGARGQRCVAEFVKILAVTRRDGPTSREVGYGSVPSAGYRTFPSLMKRAAAAAVLFVLGLGYVFSVTALVHSRFEEPLLAGEPLRSAWPLLSGVAARDEAWATLERTLSEAPWETHEDVRMPVGDGSEPDDAKPAGGTSAEDELIALAELTDSLALPTAAEPTTALPEVAAERFGMWSTERACVRVAGDADFDRESYKRAGALPWFDAASQATVTTELAADDASYRYWRREIGSGRLPFAGCVRVEEFLAAFDYCLVDRRPQDHLVDRAVVSGADAPRIRVAAAPSPYGGPLADTFTASVACRRWLVSVGIATSGVAEASEPSNSVDVPLVTLRFVPERVKAYRIIGYGLAQASGDDRAQAAAVAGEPIERAPVFQGESTILFEIELADGEVSPVRLGEVRLDWHNKQGAVHADAPLDRGLFAEHFEVAPPGWRQAAVVAMAAETLAGSPFAAGISLGEVAALARKIEPLVDDRAGWREFIDMIGKAQGLKSMYRSLGALPRGRVMNYQ